MWWANLGVRCYLKQKALCVPVYGSPCDYLTWQLLSTHIPLFLFLRPFSLIFLSFSFLECGVEVVQTKWSLWNSSFFDSWYFFFPFNSSCRGTFWMVQCPWPWFNVDFSNCTPYYPFPLLSTNTEKLLSCGSRDVGWEFLAYRVTHSSFSCLMHIGKKSATEFSHLSKSLLISSYSPCQLWNPS